MQKIITEYVRQKEKQKERRYGNDLSPSGQQCVCSVVKED